MAEHDNGRQFKDELLIAYLDGEVDPETATQIESSAPDRRRAAELAGLQSALTARLYRVSCPGSVELGEYALGLLDRPHALAIEGHARDCPHCAEEIVQFREFLADETIPAISSLAERVRVITARLISHLGDSLIPPAAAPVLAVRGEEGGTFIFEADDAQIAVEVMEDRDHPGKKSIAGLISGMEVSGLQVRLSSEGEAIAQTEVDELGNFTFAALLPGGYELSILGPHIEIRIPPLQL